MGVGARGVGVVAGSGEGIAGAGGPDTPGVGWAAGVERLAMLLADLPDEPRPVVVVPVGESVELEG